VLPTARGLLGPADLLTPGDTAANPVLELAGEVVPLDMGTAWSDGGVAMIAVHLPLDAWPDDRRRRGTEPEDCLAVGDYTAAPLPLAAARLTEAQVGDGREGGWTVDPAIAVDESWHGAAVVARIDGALIGVLLVEDDVARVALLP